MNLNLSVQARVSNTYFDGHSYVSYHVHVLTQSYAIICIADARFRIFCLQARQSKTLKLSF